MYTQGVEKNPNRNWDWLSGILLFLLLQVSAARLVTTNWAPYLYFAETLAGFGVMLGLALGASRFSRAAVIWLGIMYSLMVLPWQMAGAATEKLLLDRLQAVGGILLVSLGQFLQREPVKDSLFFVAFACLVFWTLAIVAGYWVARHRNVLVGIIPSAILVLMIQVFANYQLHGSWWLAVYLLIALLLVGRRYYLKSEKAWLERRVFVNDEAWPNILGGLLAVVASTIIIAWLLPTSVSSVQGASDTWATITHGIRTRLSNAVAALNGPNGKPGTDFYGTSLALGQNAATGDSPVFGVEVLKTPDSNLRYYWRGRVYDNYSQGQWAASSASTLDFEPAAGNLNVPDLENRSEADLQFTVQFPTQTLIYAPSEAVWIDRPANVEIAPASAGLDEILAWQTKRSIANGNHYEVRAEIGNPNVQQLRAAPTSYPQWIQDRYLEVPGSIRPKLQALAEKVTAGQETPFDKASAITTYLRSNLKYSASLPSAPEGRDPIEWVLFTYKQGFCNYYASAEVLMLRSVGVPARLAVGFAQGENQNGTYEVRRRDAHAWPEVFFPGLGWVEFEPTASQQPLVRSDPTTRFTGGLPNRPGDRRFEDGGQIPLNPAVGPGTTSPAVTFGKSVAGRSILIGLCIVGLALLIYLSYRYHAMAFVPVVLSRALESSGVSTPLWIENWLRWNRLLPVEQAFASINWSLRWLEKAPPVHATPSERAVTLKRLLPEAAAHIDAVASELETGLFTAEPANVQRARRAGLLVLVHALRARLAHYTGM